MRANKPHRFSLVIWFLLVSLPIFVSGVFGASGLTLQPLSTGTFKANYADLVTGGTSETVRLPIPVYLIRHPQGVVLFDSGLGTRFDREVSGWWVNQLLEIFLPYRLLPKETAVQQLRELGIPPGAVTTVVVSHLHFDHAGGLRDFPQAQVVVSRAEWDNAQVGRWRARMRGIIKEQLEGLKIWPIDYQPGTAYSSFEASLDLFGDGSLLLLSTPGHTPGHQSLLVTTGSGKKILLTGDAVWVRENYEQPSPKGWKVRLVGEETEEAWRTTLAIRQFHQDHPEVLIIPGHDPHLWETLPKVFE